MKAEELVSKIKDSQLTSVELCERYIERVEKFEKDVKAWAHFDKKLLLEKAAEEITRTNSKSTRSFQARNHSSKSSSSSQSMS